MSIEAAKLVESIRKLFASDRDEDSVVGPFEVMKSAEEWHRVLTPEQHRILRQHGTERPGSSRLLKENRSGTYRCAACGEAVYVSDSKFDSGTGWPSFTAPVGDNVAISIDRGMMMARTEVHCAKCGGHLGHRFADGPAPSGMRHCINGAALSFDAD